jgi:hypothetical protein
LEKIKEQKEDSTQNNNRQELHQERIEGIQNDEDEFFKRKKKPNFTKLMMKGTYIFEKDEDRNKVYVAELVINKQLVYPFYYLNIQNSIRIYKDVATRCNWNFNRISVK